MQYSEDELIDKSGQALPDYIRYSDGKHEFCFRENLCKDSEIKLFKNDGISEKEVNDLFQNLCLKAYDKQPYQHLLNPKNPEDFKLIAVVFEPKNIEENYSVSFFYNDGSKYHQITAGYETKIDW